MEKFKLADKMVYSDTSLTKKLIYRDKDMMAFVLNFKPGQELPSHNHPGMVTTIQVLTGTADFTADKETFGIAAGEIVIIQEDERASLINSGKDNLSLYVTLTPGPTDERYAQEI